MSSNIKRQLKYQRAREIKRILKISNTVNTEEDVAVLPPSLLVQTPCSYSNEESQVSESFHSNDLLDDDMYLDSDDDYIFENLNEEISDNTEANLNEEISDNTKANSDISLLLYFWCLQFNISNNAMSSLLVILQKYFPDLPRDSRTFKRTPRKTIVQDLANGTYYHFGLLQTISAFLKKNIDYVTGNLLNIDVGIDGLPLFKSSKSQFWPILGNVVGFPDVFVIGNYHGTEKPVNSELFLKQFISDGLDKIKNGIIFNGKKYFIKFRAFVCDAPARSFVLQIKGHTGYSACTKCTTVGKYVLNRVTFPELDASLRTDQSFMDREDPNHHHSTSEPLGLERIDIGCVSQFPLDYMHCVLLGVMKQLLNLWIKVRRRPFSLSAEQINKISDLIKVLCPQVTFEFKRKPRTLDNFERFKATEFRLFLLYLGPLVLKGNLPVIYYNHFIKFHVAIRILSDPIDCVQNNELARNLLTDFVTEFSQLYGEHTITFNVHNMIHVADDVLQFGNFDNYSAFKFENYMQVLKKRVRKGSQPLKQLVNRIKEEDSVTEIFGFCSSTFPSFKLQLKDKTFTSVQMKEHKLSIKSPNNFCLLENKVIKITKIENIENNARFTGKPVKNLSCFYTNPISSKFLNIYCTENIELDNEIAFNNVSLKKVVHLCINNVSVFMPNMHIN